LKEHRLNFAPVYSDSSMQERWLRKMGYFEWNRTRARDCF